MVCGCFLGASCIQSCMTGAVNMTQILKSIMLIYYVVNVGLDVNVHIDACPLGGKRLCLTGTFRLRWLAVTLVIAKQL